MNYLPMLFGRYWYVISYIFMFPLIPYINSFIKSVSKEQLFKFIVIVFIFLSIVPNIFFMNDFFKIESGYSPFWLIYLYIIGGFIKLYMNDINDNKKIIKIGIANILLAFIVNVAIRNINNLFIFNNLYNEWFINYISPFIIFTSISMLLLFKNINVKDSFNKLIKFLSVSSFSVYIIHSNKVVYDYLITNNCGFLANYNEIILVIGILVLISLIYVLCSLLDEVRKVIFKIFYINKLIDFIGTKLDKII